MNGRSVSMMLACGLMLVASAATSLGADPPGEAEETDYPGVRFTPELARLLAGGYVRGVLSQRYGLPEGQLEAAQETIARRIMQFAHSVDGPGQELIERAFEAHFRYGAETDSHDLVPPTFGKEFSERVLPMLPGIRELVRNVGQDVRPMLPMKGQLKLAGDLVAVNAAMDGFEETMKRWSSGEAITYSDPFHPEPKRQEKNESGESPQLQTARRYARGTADFRWAKNWERYLEQFKRLYELDAAQSATADSIFREYAELEIRITQDPAWRDPVYLSDLWIQMSSQLPGGGSYPVSWFLSDSLEDAWGRKTELDRSFKHRLESIPTEAQTRRVREHVARQLKEKGLTTTQPSR